MERKKILFFIYRLGGGGAARTMLNIVNHIDRNHFEPILVTLDFTYDYEQYVKEDVTFIKLPTKRLRSSIFPLASFIRNIRPDLIFSTIPTYNTVATLAKLLSFTPAKLVVREAAFLGGTPRENMKLRIFGFVYRFADHVVALSKGVKENLAARYGLKRKKIKVIYNPVDLKHIHKQANETCPAIMKKMHEEDAKIIVTAGRLVKEKDQNTLLRAFAKVSNQINAHLIILGEGELESDLKKLAKNLSVADKVHFIGFQKNPYVYFKHADLFVLSSLSEGFGHVLVEAMATGTPIVSTNCEPGAEEVLDDGEYGKIANVGDATGLSEQMLASLQQSEEETEAVVQKGLRRAEQFDATAILKQYETLFMETIDRRAKRRRNR